QARVAVWTGDWNTAISAADKILAQYPNLMSYEQYGGKNTGTAENPEYRPETNGFLNNAVNPEVILGFPLGTANTYHHAYTNPFGEVPVAYPGHIKGLTIGYMIKMLKTIIVKRYLLPRP